MIRGNPWFLPAKDPETGTHGGKEKQSARSGTQKSAAGISAPATLFLLIRKFFFSFHPSVKRQTG